MKETLKNLEREKDSHKGENGRVTVVGGSRDFTGAPSLSARASLRTGSDLVKIVTSETVRDVVASYSENLIVGSYPSEYLGLSGVEPVLKAVSWSDSTVIGPGLGTPDAEAIEEIVSRAEKPLVIDADAIEPALEAKVANAVFTPQSREAEPIRENYGSIESFVEQTESVVVLKGEKDIVYTSEEVYENETGHPTMTVGGTGDVLTGIIASLISQGLSLEEAARLGAWINGKAGEKAAEKYGNGALATDILEEFPKVIRGQL